MKYFIFIIYMLFASLFTLEAKADDPIIDKIYHPYVLPLTQEFEWRYTANERNDRLPNENNTLSQRIGYGRAISEKITLQGYLVGEKVNKNNYVLQAYELDFRWMLTEQGEYDIDWGMLFQIEKQHQKNNWAMKTGILAETEIGKSSITANMFVLYGNGKTLNNALPQNNTDNITNEWESQFNLQYRYRLKPEFQPAIEFYAGSDILGVGPAFQGVHRFEKQKQLKWDAGVIFGLNNDSSNSILRLSIKYEF